MADAKISELLELTVPADDDLLAIVDDSEIPITTKKIKYSNLSPVFGREWQHTSSDAESTTTSSTFQEKLKLTTSSLPAGDYRIEWYYESGSAANDKQYEARVQLNDTTDIAITNGAHKINTGTESQQGMGGFYIASAISGVQTIDIDYRSPGGTNAAKIRRARIAIYRVA